MSDFDSERSWASWFHRTGRKVQGTGKTAKQRAAHARNIRAAQEVRRKGKGDDHRESR